MKRILLLLSIIVLTFSINCDTLAKSVQIGDCVQIINGPFTGFRGLILEEDTRGRFIVRMCDSQVCLQFPAEKKNLKEIPIEACKEAND